MTAVDWLALALFPALLVNWLAFATFAVIANRHLDVRSLRDRVWLSLGIGAANTALVVLALTYIWGDSLGAGVNALLLIGPVLALTAVNVVALWLTWRRGW